MASSVWPTVHAERAALADDLARLADEQWVTPSLCGDWTVHQVLGHMLSTAKTTPPTFVARFVGAGFDFGKFAAKQVAVETAGGPAATLAAFRGVVNSTSAPPGPKTSWLGETLVHSEDIRRPLGIVHAYPLPDVARTIEFYAGSNALIGGKKRVAGLRLVATDSEFEHGAGPDVRGPAMSLLLATAGRRGALDELSGDSVAVLHERS